MVPLPFLGLFVHIFVWILYEGSQQCTSWKFHGFLTQKSEPEFLNFYGAQESIPRIDFVSLCSLADRYDNPFCRTGLPGFIVGGMGSVKDKKFGLRSLTIYQPHQDIRFTFYRSIIWGHMTFLYNTSICVDMFYTWIRTRRYSMCLVPQCSYFQVLTN